MSEAKLLLKENGRERINAIYNIKEQCRKEFQDEIARLRNQFQMVRLKHWNDQIFLSFLFSGEKFGLFSNSKSSQRIRRNFRSNLN